MNVQKSLILCLFISVLNTGCTSNKTQFQACTNDWFLHIEKNILTGDGQGHGPDIGSLEWRSVIESQLGVRNDPTIPSIESEQWCHSINERFQKNVYLTSPNTHHQNIKR